MMAPLAPLASIVVPTRNRPHLLRQALASILAQTNREFEVVVVDDGSSGEHLAAMRALGAELDSRFVFLFRDPGEYRHGPAAARNAGIARARGRYVGFLDDDDYWCDPSHLEKAYKCLAQCPELDLYVCDQAAKRNEQVVVEHWLPSLNSVLAKRSRILDPDTYEVHRRDLLQPGGIGFAHVNMCLVRRELVRSIDGFWGGAIYEEDLDFFLRVVDRAERFAYRSATVSVNTLRDASAAAGVSSIPDESKRLGRMMVCQHALLHCTRAEVRAYARLLLAGTLKTLSKVSLGAGRIGQARDLAAQAAAVDGSLRWKLIALYLSLRAAWSRA